MKLLYSLLLTLTISIPHGPIEAFAAYVKVAAEKLFQFLTVRLKPWRIARLQAFSDLFQFLTVRLKPPTPSLPP